MNFLNNILQKYRTMGLPTKAAVWYMVCNVLQKGIAFIVVPIYVRMLTTTEYGQYTVFQSWREILMILATLNLYCGVFTKAMVDYEDDRDRYTSSAQTLSTLLTLIMLFVYFVAQDFWNDCLDMSTTTVLLMIAYFIFYPSLQFWSVRQRVMYRYKQMVGITMLTSVFTPIVSILLLELTSLRAEAVIYGSMLVQIIVGVYFYFFQLAKGKCLFHKEYWISSLKFNVPLIPHYLSLIVLGQADRIMISDFCGEAKAGIYSLAYSVSQLMMIFVSAINNSFVPWLYENLKKREYAVVRKVSNSIRLLMAFITLGTILISPEIVRILGTEEYMEAIWILPIVSMSCFYTYCYDLFSSIEFYYNSTSFVMVASTVGAVMNVVLNKIFIPLYGYIAAGYTTLVCYFVLLAMHFYFARKVCIAHMGSDRAYDLKHMGILIIVLFVLMLLCMLLYKNTLIRYAVIGVMVVISCINYEKIKTRILQLL